MPANRQATQYDFKATRFKHHRKGGYSMKLIAAIAMLFLTVSSVLYFDCYSQVQAQTWEWGLEKKHGTVTVKMVNQEKKPQVQALAGESELDQEVRRLMEKGGKLEERKRQIPAIAESFARRTDPRRARILAALCYLKTLGTPFMPIDIAEIALAETGCYGLVGNKASHKGALGVWQLMPSRAKSHGYSPKDMENDENCADAAVRELATKLVMAKGNLPKAKKLYCGIGREADAYETKRRQYRKEILDILSASRPITPKQAFYAEETHQVTAIRE
jgi:hypothetical protein